jgi:hypothetical protein
VEADLPDEADESPDGNADRRDDQDGGGGQANRPGNADAEPRNREEYYADLRTAVSTEESTTIRRITAERGDLQYQFIEVNEDEANQIVARIRAKVAGTNDL